MKTVYEEIKDKLSSIGLTPNYNEEFDDNGAFILKYDIAIVGRLDSNGEVIVNFEVNCSPEVSAMITHMLYTCSTKIVIGDVYMTDPTTKKIIIGDECKERNLELLLEETVKKINMINVINTSFNNNIKAWSTELPFSL